MTEAQARTENAPSATILWTPQPKVRGREPVFAPGTPRFESCRHDFEVGNCAHHEITDAEVVDSGGDREQGGWHVFNATCGSCGASLQGKGGPDSEDVERWEVVAL